MPLDFRKEALKHIKRLEAYAKKIEQAYEKANKELSRIAVSVNHPVEELFKLKDYPEIKARVDKVIKELHDSIETIVLNGEKLEWGYANKVNNTLAETVTGLTATEAAESVKYKRYFNQNAPALAAFQKRKENGLNLSKRVWNLTDQYKRDMELGLSVGISDGRSAAQLSRDLRAYLNEPNKLFRRVRDEYGNLVLSKNAAAYHPGQGVYRSSYKNAMRVARTEINMAYRAADEERWQQMDFVLGYKIARSNNPYPCPVCETLQGNYPKNFIWSGWHPQCRCVRTPILQDIDAFLADEDAVLDGGEPIETRKGTIKDVSDNFKQWVADNQERIEKSNNRGTLPYWVRENPEYVGIDVKSINTGRQTDIRQKARERYNSYGSEWSKEYFDKYSGGFTVYHKDHQFSDYGGGGEAEKTVGKMLAKFNGKQVEFLSELSNEGKKSDLFFDGQAWDVKRVNVNNVKAFRRDINRVKDKRSDNVIFYFESPDQRATMLEAISREVGSRKKDGSWAFLPDVYYMTPDGLLRSVWKKK